MTLCRRGIIRSTVLIFVNAITGIRSCISFSSLLSLLLQLRRKKNTGEPESCQCDPHAAAQYCTNLTPEAPRSFPRAMGLGHGDTEQDTDTEP